MPTCTIAQAGSLHPGIVGRAQSIRSQDVSNARSKIAAVRERCEPTNHTLTVFIAAKATKRLQVGPGPLKKGPLPTALLFFAKVIFERFTVVTD